MAPAAAAGLPARGCAPPPQPLLPGLSPAGFFIFVVVTLGKRNGSDGAGFEQGVRRSRLDKGGFAEPSGPPGLREGASRGALKDWG